MADSGIPVDPECKTIYEELKQKKKHKYIVFAIVEEKIKVIKTSTNPDYAEVLKELPAIFKDKCRWVAYDAYADMNDGLKKSKICFISWVPDGAGKDKMKYSTSKAALRKAIDQSSLVELQATDMDEADQTALEYKLQGKLI